MISKQDIIKNKVILLSLLTILIFSFVFAKPIISFFISLCLIPIFIKYICSLLHYYLKRKCQKCRAIMLPNYYTIFDGADSTEDKLGFPPVAVKEETCVSCNTKHLQLFNPVGIISNNVGNFNALHNIADEDFVRLHLKSIEDGGRLPSSRFITSGAYQLLIKVLIKKVQNTNIVAGFKQSDKDVKDFIRYLK